MYAVDAGRHQFLVDISTFVITVWIQMRTDTPTLRRPLREGIHKIYKIDATIETVNPLKKRKTGYYCLSRLRRMTTNYCIECSCPTCSEHKRNCCISCASK